MTFKIGQKVRVKEKFWELPNPTGLDRTSTKKISLAGKILEVGSTCGDGDISTRGDAILGIDTAWWWHPTWLEPVVKTLYDLEEGDVVENGEEQMVLGVSGKVYHLSFRGDFERSGANYTAKDLENWGYTIKNQPIEETLTIEGKTYSKEDVLERLKELKEI